MPSANSLAEKYEEEMDAFEGSEKKMEIDFVPVTGEDPETIPVDGGMRTYRREFWSDVVALLNGTILLHDPQERFDAYLISESSLFVYNDRVVILTCGTTLLLKTLPTMIKAAKDIGLDVSWFQYSRKNFLFPEKQLFPHTSFDQEVDFLHEIFPQGRPFVMGPMTSDHWYLFVADFIRRESVNGNRKIVDKDQMLNVYMYDIDPAVAQLFMRADSLILPSIFREDAADAADLQDKDKDEENQQNLASPTDFCGSGEEASARSGIDRLMPDGSVVHSHLFEPCGYSMNGEAGNGAAYWTIHITPEAHCSYASFETNHACPSYHALIQRIVATFRPKRLTTVEHIDQDSCISTAGPVVPVEIDGYRMNGRTLNEFGCKDYVVQMCNFQLHA